MSYDASTLQQLAEGKTKKIFAVDNEKVLVQSKDRITAFNNERKNELAGKAQLSNMTNGRVFSFLNLLGLKTHYVFEHSETEFVAQRCEMIPLEWIARRVATGSFLKRNPAVPEGFRFNPPKVEITYKDDDLGDPLWSDEQVLGSKITCGGLLIGPQQLEEMRLQTRAIFEVLERAWRFQGCSLIDMKIEFGVNQKGEIILADVIDSDSWRLWPAGDRRLQLDKQFYRDLPEVSVEALKQLKQNFEKSLEMLKKFDNPISGRVVILMGSASDRAFCDQIQTTCEKIGIPTVVQRLCSAHKSTEFTLSVVAEYEGDGVPTVFIAVAGRSNGLGPVVSGNSVYPVINCPPVKADWVSQDIWSSLHLPSGLGCSTVLGADAAAINAATILGQSNHILWGKLKIKQTNTYLDLMRTDGASLNNSQSSDVTNGKA